MSKFQVKTYSHRGGAKPRLLTSFYFSTQEDAEQYATDARLLGLAAVIGDDSDVQLDQDDTLTSAERAESEIIGY